MLIGVLNYELDIVILFLLPNKKCKTANQDKWIESLGWDFVLL